MAEADSDGNTAPPDKKKDANRQRILIGVGVVGLILTYLLIKRSQSWSRGTTTASTSDSDALQQYESQNASDLRTWLLSCRHYKIR